MEQHLRIEIVPRTVEADERTIIQRSAVMERLANLGQVDDVDAGQVSDTVTTWTARINGAEFPIYGYEAGALVDGRVMVTLSVPADALSVGSPTTAGSASPATDKPVEAPAVNMWGRPGLDPRQNIPGWAPDTIGGQVAGDAIGRHA